MDHRSPKAALTPIEASATATPIGALRTNEPSRRSPETAAPKRCPRGSIIRAGGSLAAAAAGTAFGMRWIVHHIAYSSSRSSPSTPGLDSPWLHDYAGVAYSHAPMTTVSARPLRNRPARGDDRAVRVAIVGATGYVGSELVRLLTRHPNVQIVGLVGRGRDREPVEATHPSLATTGLVVDAEMPEADAVLLAP